MGMFTASGTSEHKRPQEDEYLGVGGMLFEMVKVFLLAVVIIIPVRVLLFQPFFVQGSSMEPNFEDGEYLVIGEFGYKQTDVSFGDHLRFSVRPFRTLERQEPVVFHYPKNPDQYFIKRVIGLPGEIVEIRRGKIIISSSERPEGGALDESAYLSPAVVTPDMPPMTLEPDEYFVLGDNRQFSYDSRSIGPIKKDKIIGRVLFRAWPVERMSLY